MKRTGHPQSEFRAWLLTIFFTACVIGSALLGYSPGLFSKLFGDGKDIIYVFAENGGQSVMDK